MEIAEITKALDEGVVLFELEQRVRRTAPTIADLIVAHREAIVRDGARALLQRLGQASGSVWLEPLLPEAIIGQPLWGHEGPIKSMWADGEVLVTRGENDGRLRRFAVDGRCLEDRDATRRDDARMLDDDLVVVQSKSVKLCDPETGRIRRRVQLPKANDYSWIDEVRLLDDGTVGLKFGEDDPGSLYGPEYEWVRFDPRDGSRTKMDTPSEEVVVAGRVAVALADGTIRLVEDRAALARAPAHAGRVLAVALGPGRFVSGSGDGIRIHDRSGELLTRGAERQPGLAQIVLADRIVTTSRYIHDGNRTQPHARLWDRDTAAAGAKIEAGDRYKDFISCDPTGARLAYSKSGALYLHELGEGAGEPKRVELTWHWNRCHAWSPDGLRFAIQHYGVMPTVWDLASGERERILTTQVLDSAHFGLSEDGAVATIDHSFYRLHAIRVEDGAVLDSLEPGETLSCSCSSGTKGVCGGVSGGFWFDLATNERIQHKQGPWIRACHVSGGFAALAGSDGVYAIELETGELLWRWVYTETEQLHVAVIGDSIVCLDEDGQLRTLAEGELVRQTTAMRTRCSQGASMCALEDGTVLVGCPDGVIRRWHPRTGELLGEHVIGGTAITHLSTGGAKVLCCRRDHRDHSRTWLMFALDGWTPLPLPADAERPRLTADGRRLVSLDTIARLDVLDARTAEPLDRREFGNWPVAEDIMFEDGELRAVDVVPVRDGVHAVLVDDDGSIVVTREGRPVARWVAPRTWTCVAIDGDRVAAGDADGELALWALHVDQDHGL